MKNKFLSSKLLISGFLSTLLFASNIKAADNPNLSASNNPDHAKDQLADQTDLLNQVLTSDELDVIDDNPDKLYCYISSDVISCFNSIEVSEKTSDTLKMMQDHIRNYRSAEHSFVLEAVNQAIEYFESCKSEAHVNVLQKYRSEVEMGEAAITAEGSTRRRKRKKYCSLLVQRDLRTRSLCVRRNARVGGDLCVSRNLSVGCNSTLNTFTANTGTVTDLNVPGTLTATNAVIDTLTVGTINGGGLGGSGILSALSAVTNTGFLSGFATLTFPTTFDIAYDPTTDDVSGTFNIVVNYGNTTLAGVSALAITRQITTASGVITGTNLSDNDPVSANFQAFSCLGDRYPKLFALNLSFNVAIPGTNFVAGSTPTVAVSLQNLAVANDVSLSQFFVSDPLSITDCYNCYVCRHPNDEVENFDVTTIRSITDGVAASINSVTPVVNNISVSANGVLSFTVNILVSAYDSEVLPTTTDTLAALTGLLNQYFANSAVTLTVSGPVNS